MKNTSWIQLKWDVAESREREELKEQESWCNMEIDFVDGKVKIMVCKV